MRLRSGFITKFMIIFLTVCMFIGIMMPETTYAASTESISVTGTYNYSMANSVLTEVNNQRSKNGRSKLVLDKDLTSAAMKRAAELSIYYSHTRPNGSSWSTGYSKLGNASGENIAAGQSSASAVMNSWMNSSGHKANILSKDYKSIGIGSFTNNGTTYWVQVFSSNSGTSQSKSGSSSTTVSVSAKSSYISGCLSLTPASSSINKGKTTGITAYLKNKGASAFKAKINNSCLKWSSGSTSVATVNSSGTVTGKAKGSAKITAKTSAGGASASTTIMVNGSGSSTGTGSTGSTSSSKTKITSCSVSLSKSTYYYDGTAKKPTVTVKKGSKTLKAGTDYTVSYKNNVNKGQACVVITGKGNYTGTGNKYFSIKAFSITGCSISLSKTSYTYDGTAKKPTATVKRGSSTTLKAGTDYTISYKDNTKVGTATAVITGKGNYTGTVAKTFKIKESSSSSSTTKSTTTTTTSKPATTSISSLKSSASGQMTVKWNKVSGVGGYQLYYSESPNFYASASYDTKCYEIWPSDSYTSYTFTNMQKGKTYYVKMRTYQKINGKKTYSDWSNVKSITIAK